MADHKTQAKNLREQADKKLKSFSFFSSKSGRSEEAAELYKKAANLLKVAKLDNEAAESYIDAANCYKDTPNNSHEEASCYVKAAGCYKKEKYNDAVDALKEAIKLYTSEGRFSMAAKYEKEIAEMLEENGTPEEKKDAIAHYETAANYFESENSPSTANGCLLKVAHLSADSADFAKAIQIFEDVSKTSMNNKLLSYSVKEYLFKAGLCSLCSAGTNNDLVAAKKALSRFTGIDPTFASTREYKFLAAITDAVENRNEEEFDQILEEFTTVTPLDMWKSNLVSKIQGQLKKNDEEDSDGVL